MKIETYFKNGDKFCLLDEKFNATNFFQKIPNSDEIEGGLNITIGDDLVISEQNWDYVHEIWGYFLGSLEDLFVKGSTRFYYPSTVVEFSFRKAGDQIILEFPRPDGSLIRGPFSCDYEDFILKLDESARQFYDVCLQLYQPWDSQKSFDFELALLKGEVNKFKSK